jgi:hypothetical protein
MIPLYILETKIYLFSTIFLQFEQITGLKSIDSRSDVRDLLVRPIKKYKVYLRNKIGHRPPESEPVLCAAERRYRRALSLWPNVVVSSRPSATVPHLGRGIAPLLHFFPMAEFVPCSPKSKKTGCIRRGCHSCSSTRATPWLCHAPKNFGMASDGLRRHQLLARVPPLARYQSTSRGADGYGGARMGNKESRAGEQRATSSSSELRPSLLSISSRCELPPTPAASTNPCSWRERAAAAQVGGAAAMVGWRDDSGWGWEARRRWWHGFTGDAGKKKMALPFSFSFNFY